MVEERGGGGGRARADCEAEEDSVVRVAALTLFGGADGWGGATGRPEEEEERGKSRVLLASTNHQIGRAHV